LLSNAYRNIVITSSNPEKLISIFLTNNDLSSQDLSCFQPFVNFVNLELLDVGNNDEKRIFQNIYNRFYGSLEYLKNLSKLQ